MPFEFHDRLIALGFTYIRLFDDGIFKMDMLVSCSSVRHAVLFMYCTLAAKGTIKTIETLDQETKLKLWEACKPHLKNLPAGERVDFARCYWVLDNVAAIKRDCSIVNK